MKKQFLILLSSILILIGLMGSCSLLLDTKQNQNPATEKELEQSEAKQVEEEQEPPEEYRSSYSFAGNFDGLTSFEEEEKKDKPEPETAEEKEIEGKIPELTIETYNVDMEEVARHFGYVKALITSDRILGVIENGELESVDEAYLQNFAGRAREGRVTEEIRPLVANLTEELNVPVRPVYLVPNEVEQQFIQIQFEAISERGLKPEEVDLVRARYNEDFSVEVMEVR